VRFMPKQILLSLLMMIGIGFLLVACGGPLPTASLPTPSLPVVALSFTPDLVPVTFSIDTSGKVSVALGANLVTPLGVVALTVKEAGSALPSPSPQLSSQAQQTAMLGDSLLLIIRHKQGNTLQDDNYQIHAKQSIQRIDVKGHLGEVQIQWVGTHYEVFVDASSGDITSINLQGAATNTSPPVVTTPASTSFLSTTPVSTPTSGCPSLDAVATSMNLSTQNLQQVGDEPCAFHWTNPSPGTGLTAQCAVGHGPSSIETGSGDDAEDAEKIVCNGVDATQLQAVSNASSATITFTNEEESPAATSTPDHEDATPDHDQATPDHEDDASDQENP